VMAVDGVPWCWLEDTWSRWLLGYVWSLLALILFAATIFPAIKVFDTTYGMYVYVYRSVCVVFWAIVFFMSSTNRSSSYAFDVAFSIIIPLEGLVDSIAFCWSERLLETWIRRLCALCCRRSTENGLAAVDSTRLLTFASFIDEQECKNYATESAAAVAHASSQHAIRQSAGRASRGGDSSGPGGSSTNLGGAILA
jgi:hypothetical protein